MDFEKPKKIYKILQFGSLSRKKGQLFEHPKNGRKFIQDMAFTLTLSTPPSLVASTWVVAGTLNSIFYKSAHYLAYYCLHRYAMNTQAIGTNKF